MSAGSDLGFRDVLALGSDGVWLQQGIGRMEKRIWSE